MKSIPGTMLPSVKSDLFSLGKEVVRISVECHLSNSLHRNNSSGIILVGSRRSKSNLCSSFLLDDLNAKLPFRIIAVLNRFPQIATMKIRVLTRNFLCFIPNNRVQTKQWFPMKLHEARLSWLR